MRDTMSTVLMPGIVCLLPITIVAVVRFHGPTRGISRRSLFTPRHQHHTSDMAHVNS